MTANAPTNFEIVLPANVKLIVRAIVGNSSPRLPTNTSRTMSEDDPFGEGWQKEAMKMPKKEIVEQYAILGKRHMALPGWLESLPHMVSTDWLAGEIRKR